MQSFFNPGFSTALQTIRNLSRTDREKVLERLDIHALRELRKAVDEVIKGIKDPSPFYNELLQVKAGISVEKAKHGVAYHMRYECMSPNILDLDELQWNTSASIWGEYATALNNYQVEVDKVKQVGNLIEEYIISLSLSNVENFIQAF